MRHGRVEYRTHVAIAEYQAIALRPVGLCRFMTEYIKREEREDIGYI